MRILAFVPGGISNQLLFSPTLDHLQHHSPQAQIDVVVEPRAKGAYRVSGTVHRVFTFDYRNRNGLADWANLIGSLREREYDAAIAIGRNHLVGPLLWLMGSPKRVGYAGGWGQRFLTDAVSLNPQQYVPRMYHDLLRGMGITSPCPELRVQIPPADQDWAQVEQKRLGLSPGQDYLLLHGGSSRYNQQKGIDKIYSTSGWQSVLKGLHERFPQLPLFVLQGPEDRNWVQPLTATLPHLQAVQPDNIGQLAAMIDDAKVMICTDSAPMQLGVAMKTKVIALFGITDPEKQLPPEGNCIGLKSPTGKIADVSPIQVVEQVELD